MSAPPSDLERIRQLAELMEAAGISELEISKGTESVRIVRPLEGAAAAQQAAAQQAAVSPGAGQGAAPLPAAAAGQPVRAPMAGTFYTAPEPGADPFVHEGQAVAPGDVLCIIESMKMMNEIKAEQRGTCMAIRAANGQPVGEGDVLFVIG